MPVPINVEIEGFDTLLAGLAAVEQGIGPALNRAARRLAEDALKAWRSQVRVRTGRMRRALAFRITEVPGGVTVALFVGAGGFYYRWQSDARRWTAHVERFAQDNAGSYIVREVNALIQRS